MGELRDGFYWLRGRLNNGEPDPNWRVGRYSEGTRWFFVDGNEDAWSVDEVIEVGERIERAALTTKSEKLAGLVEAVKQVREIICDGAVTGFNPTDGDWAERLYASQGVTNAALEAVGVKHRYAAKASQKDGA